MLTARLKFLYWSSASLSERELVSTIFNHTLIFSNHYCGVATITTSIMPLLQAMINISSNCSTISSVILLSLLLLSAISCGSTEIGHCHFSNTKAIVIPQTHQSLYISPASVVCFFLQAIVINERNIITPDPAGSLLPMPVIATI